MIVGSIVHDPARSMVGDDHRRYPSAAGVGCPGRVGAATTLVSSLALVLLILIEGDHDGTVGRRAPQRRIHDSLHQLTNDPVTASDERRGIGLAAVSRYIRTR